jgi:mRNA interferase MazF
VARTVHHYRRRAFHRTDRRGGETASREDGARIAASPRRRTARSIDIDGAALDHQNNVQPDPHGGLGRPEGREAGDLHPAVVVTAQRILNSAPTVIQVVPLTSTLRGFHAEVVIEPDPANGLEQSSAAQCQHVRAVSPARVVGTLGNIGPLALSQIRETIAVIIDVP